MSDCWQLRLIRECNRTVRWHPIIITSNLKFKEEKSKKKKKTRQASVWYIRFFFPLSVWQRCDNDEKVEMVMWCDYRSKGRQPFFQTQPVERKNKKNDYIFDRESYCYSVGSVFADSFEQFHFQSVYQHSWGTRNGKNWTCLVTSKGVFLWIPSGILRST